LLLKHLEIWFPRAGTFGLDIDTALIQSARNETQRSSFVRASAQSIPFDDGAFDAIVALHVVEHLPEPAQFFSEARRLLRPSGVLLVATPNPNGIGACVMGQAWAGWRDETHISLNPPPFWNALIRQNGFRVLEEGTTGFSGIPLFRQFPLALFNWGLLFLFGFFPWSCGEAYVCLAAREM